MYNLLFDDFIDILQASSCCSSVLLLFPLDLFSFVNVSPSSSLPLSFGTGRSKSQIAAITQMQSMIQCNKRGFF